MDANWQRFLFPRTIAIVGASESGFSSGNVFRNLRGFGFTGEIIPVHPRNATVFGLRAYPSLQDAPSADAVIVLLGRDRVEEAVEQAIAARAGGVILPAGGFRESGEPAWIAAEERISAAARGAGIPLIGPNCVGVMAMPRGAAMSIGPYPWKLAAGSVALLMQSGGQLIASCRYMDYFGAGVRWAFSLGNATNVSFAEAITALSDDSEVREFVLLIEDIPDWTSFRGAVEGAYRAGKWISATTIGQTSLGQWAAATHTGAASANNDILMHGLAQLGIRVGETLGATLAAAVLHARLGEPRAGRVAITGVSGGGGGLAADLAASRGVELAVLADATKRAIERINPEIRAGNPLDIVGGPMDPVRLQDVLRVLLRDPDVGAAIFLPSQGLPDEESPAHLTMLEKVAEVAATSETPVLVSPVVQAPIPETQRPKFLARANLCLFPSLEESFSGLRTWRADPLDLPTGVHRASRTDANEGSGIEQPHDEYRLKQMLSAAGCRVPDAFALSPAEASSYAAGDASAGPAGLHWPVVVKGIGRKILHKARLKLVVLGIDSPSALQAAVRDILDSPHRGLVEAVLIEQQVEPGADVMVSVMRDRLGAVVVIGSGGAIAGEAGSRNWIGIDPTQVELISGVRRILAPMQAEHGATALAEFAGWLVRLLADNRLSLLEVNPVRLFSSGAAMALDAVAA